MLSLERDTMGYLTTFLTQQELGRFTSTCRSLVPFIQGLRRIRPQNLNVSATLESIRNNKCPQLYDVYFPVEVSDQIVNEVAQCMKMMPQVHHFAVASPGRHRDISPILRELPNMQHLVSLMLTCVSIDLTVLDSSLERAGNLRFLTLGYTKPTARNQVINMAKHLPKLEALDIGFYKEIDSGFILNLSQFCPLLSVLNISFEDSTMSNEHFLQGLAGMTNLTSISITGRNKSSSAPSSSFWDTLATLKELSEIHIQCTYPPFKDPSPMDNLIRSLPNISYFYLGWTYLLSASVPQDPRFITRFGRITLRDNTPYIPVNRFCSCGRNE